MTRHNQRLIALYDGQCDFCRASRRLFESLDRRDRISFIDLHSSETAPDADTPGAMQVRHGAQTWTGFAGIRRLVKELPLGFPIWLLLHAPGADWLGERVYGWVARNRYRIARTDCACESPERTQ